MFKMIDFSFLRRKDALPPKADKLQRHKVAKAQRINRIQNKENIKVKTIKSPRLVMSF
jgi:hypothetical protein